MGPLRGQSTKGEQSARWGLAAGLAVGIVVGVSTGIAALFVVGS